MNIEIANRLQKLRKEKGYSQEQLADALGISRQAVSKWERAESSPDTDNLICLAKLYGISLDELLSTDQTIEELKKDQEEIEREKQEEKDQVRIHQKGIDIQSKDGDTVHIGLDGIHAYDRAKNLRVNISANKVRRHIKNAVNGAVLFAVLLAYILLGTFGNYWATAWILFLLIPLTASLMEAIEKRKFASFGYPILVVAIYLYLGMQYALWHPYWCLFLSIPLYYIIADPVDKQLHQKDNYICIDENRKHIYLSDIANDDDLNALKDELKGKSFTVKIEGEEIHIEDAD